MHIEISESNYLEASKKKKVHVGHRGRAVSGEAWQPPTLYLEPDFNLAAATQGCCRNLIFSFYPVP